MASRRVAKEKEVIMGDIGRKLREEPIILEPFPDEAPAEPAVEPVPEPEPELVPASNDWFFSLFNAA